MRPRLDRRHALSQRARRDADEPAMREDVERASPLADEVRGWLETGACVDPAAREERHRCGIDVPADALGEIACLLVLCDQADERAAEIVVQCREQERQGWLRDAGVPPEMRPRRHGSARCARASRRDRTGVMPCGPCDERDSRPAGLIVAARLSPSCGRASVPERPPGALPCPCVHGSADRFTSDSPNRDLTARPTAQSGADEPQPRTSRAR